MRILALIPARGGSKRIPGKNIRPLGGKPLIEWSVNSAGDNRDICDILVSTDDPVVAETARAAGASVPWLRPPELGSDTASVVDASLHALNWYESERAPVDGLLLLQPTSPFRTRHTVARGIELFQSHRRRPVIAVSAVKHHPLWCYQVRDDGIRPFLDSESMQVRSQDLPPAYAINGALYLIAPDELRQRHSFHAGETVPLVIDDPAETLDIDTEWDWQVAEAIVAASGRDRLRPSPDVPDPP